MICANEPCEREATTFYVTQKGWQMNLCTLCGNAFQLGQANADPVAVLRWLDTGKAVEGSEEGLLDEEGEDE